MLRQGILDMIEVKLTFVEALGGVRVLLGIELREKRERVGIDHLLRESFNSQSMFGVRMSASFLRFTPCNGVKTQTRTYSVKCLIIFSVAPLRDLVGRSISYGLVWTILVCTSWTVRLIGAIKRGLSYLELRPHMVIWRHC